MLAASFVCFPMRRSRAISKRGGSVASIGAKIAQVHVGYDGVVAFRSYDQCRKGAIQRRCGIGRKPNEVPGRMKAYKGGLLKGVPMKYSNILVPYDHSESAKHAMFTALEFAAENPETHVTAFFASPVPEFESSQFLAAETVSGVRRVSPEELAGMQQDYLDYERGSLKKSLIKEFGEPLVDNARFDIAVGQGKPSKAILDFARDNGVDLIIMGCRGLNAVAGMLGSVSYAVLRNAECPVLIEK